MRNADGIEQGLYDGTRLTPEGRVEHALAWVRGDYPRKWMRLVGLCESLAAQGCSRVTRDNLYTLALQQGLDITLCDEFRMDHNLWSVLSRYILMLRPGLARVIFPRFSPALDTLDLEAMWHRRVAGTFFGAPSWMSAAWPHRDEAWRREAAKRMGRAA